MAYFVYIVLLLALLVVQELYLALLKLLNRLLVLFALVLEVCYFVLQRLFFAAVLRIVVLHRLQQHDLLFQILYLCFLLLDHLFLLHQLQLHGLQLISGYLLLRFHEFLVVTVILVPVHRAQHVGEVQQRVLVVHTQSLGQVRGEVPLLRARYEHEEL